MCVGHPVDGAKVRIAELEEGVHGEVGEGSKGGGFALEALPAGVTGEILVAAAWVSEGYAGLWATEHAARPASAEGWHRSGDVGHVDAEGRLWVEGRAVHVIHSVDGVVTPVPIERAVEQGLPIARSAAVGVGPPGRQQLVVVLEDSGADVGLADAGRTARVRSIVEQPVAAVLNSAALPVDIRHNAKIDRTAVARWADDVLAGRRARPPK